MCGVSVKDTLDVIQALIALVNVLIVVYIFRSDRKYEDIREQKNDKKDRLRRCESWYDNLVAQKVIDRVILCFDEYNQLLQKVRDGEIERMDAIQQLKTKLYSCKHAIVPNMQVFSDKLAQEVIGEMQECTESTMAGILNDEIDWYHLEQRIQQCKERVYTLIYTYDITQHEDGILNK